MTHVFTVVKFFLGNIRGGSTVARTCGRGEKPDKKQESRRETLADLGAQRTRCYAPSPFFFHLMQFSAKMIPIGNPGFATTRPFHVVLKSFPQISTNLFLYLASHSLSPVKFLHIDLFYSESFVENM